MRGRKAIDGAKNVTARVNIALTPELKAKLKRHLGWRLVGLGAQGYQPTSGEIEVNEALETMYALRIIYWCRGDRPMLRQIERDIQALKSEQN